MQLLPQVKIHTLLIVRSTAASVSRTAGEVVAINDSARRFYLKYGFTPLADDERHLYLPLSAVRKLGLA